jgi:hypothetical protein
MTSTMLTKGQEHTDQGQEYYYEQRYRERVPRAPSQRAAKLGCRWCPLHNRLENVIPNQSLGRRLLRASVAALYNCCHLQRYLLKVVALNVDEFGRFL